MTKAGLRPLKVILFHTCLQVQKAIKMTVLFLTLDVLWTQLKVCSERTLRIIRASRKILRRPSRLWSGKNIRQHRRLQQLFVPFPAAVFALWQIKRCSCWVQFFSREERHADGKTRFCTWTIPSEQWGHFTLSQLAGQSVFWILGSDIVIQFVVGQELKVETVPQDCLAPFGDIMIL